MSSLRVTKIIDAEKTLKSVFGDLFDKTDITIRKAVKHGIYVAVNNIKQLTYNKSVSVPYQLTRPSRKYGVPLIEGIRAYMYKTQLTGVVHILGDAINNDGTWRLRFFLGKGAVRKKTRHGPLEKPSVIQGYNTLKSAYDQYKDKAIEDINDSVKNAIDKLNS